MLIIPVLDLLQGQVVHARQGNRQHYKPVSSVLCPSAQPDEVIASYFKLFPFPVIYIADLDAIQGTGNHYLWLEQLADCFPGCEFWIDAGLDLFQHEPGLLHSNNIVPVIGSENPMQKSTLLELLARFPKAVLSLDFTREGFANNPYLLESSDCWPARVIVMMLTRVGTAQGIDQETLQRVKRLTGQQQLFTAGGVADSEDLRMLSEQGIAGALLATALHTGRITRHDLESLMPL